MIMTIVRAVAFVGMVVVVSSTAGATTHVWEGTDCKAQVEKVVAGLSAEENTPAKSEELMAECEKDKRDHAKKRKTRRGEGRIYRGRAK